MTAIVLFHIIMCFVSIGITLCGRWRSVLGTALFLMNGWAFYVVLESLKR